MLGSGVTASVTNTVTYAASGAQEKPRAAFNPVTEQVWVVWQDYPNPPPTPDPGPTDLRLARVAPDGAVQATAVIASQVASWPVPDVACSSTGNCAVIWGGSGSNGGVWLARLDAAGALRQAPLRLSAAPTDDPRIIAAGPQRLFLAFANNGYIYVSAWIE